MEPTHGYPASPGTPLFPVSPERANQQKTALADPASPVAPELKHASHVRAGSDVQNKVAQFNTLSKDAQDRKKSGEAALKRAIVGREEAESDLRRIRDEGRRARQEIEEGKSRERRVGERLEAVMDELHRAKETHAHSQHLYEKEVRRARKETFKSSSALVKSQEELKATRNAMRSLQDDLDQYRTKTEKHQQEAFAAQYQLVGVQEELERMRERAKVVEEERDALKMNLKEEEVARIAAEGRIALPVSREDDEFASPRKRRTPVKPRPDPTLYEDGNELAMLKEELEWEREAAREAEDTIEFMKIECQFQRCSCRVAESQGRRYVHDSSRFEAMAEMQKRMEQAMQDYVERRSPLKPSLVVESDKPASMQDDAADSSTIDTQMDEQLTVVIPTEALQRVVTRTPGRRPPTPKAPSHAKADLPAVTIPEESSLLSLLAAPYQSADPAPPPTPSPPYHHPTTTTTTTTIRLPLADADSTTASPAPTRPPPDQDAAAAIASPMISREQALAQIRERRGRARSFAAGVLTPRKQMVAGGGPIGRRDLSAPAAR